MSLAFDHDPGVAVELARLAAAEFACCSFFTFTLTIGPEGVRFTVPPMRPATSSPQSSAPPPHRIRQQLMDEGCIRYPGTGLPSTVSPPRGVMTGVGFDD